MCMQNLVDISHRHGVDMVDGSAPGHGDHEVDARVHRDEVGHHVRSEIFLILEKWY